MGQKFAQNGYDFVTVDQRGFGFSEGRDGVVEDESIASEDMLYFTEKIDEKFGGKDVPHFLVGHSLGGLISLMLSTQAPERFQGMTLYAPFMKLGFEQQQQFNKLKPYAKILNMIAPTWKLPFSSKEMPSHLQHWRDDPRDKGAQICAQNVIATDKAIMRLHKEILPNVNTPFLLITGGRDTVICNETIQRFYDQSTVVDKDMIDYADADHAIIQDGEYWEGAILDCIGWQDLRC